jgi:adenylate cyclase
MQLHEAKRMGREVERKYLVTDDRWRQRVGPGAHYRQGYLCADPQRSVRVRLAANEAALTIKGNVEGAARDEFEYPIPAADANQILERLCIKPIIEKTRYEIQFGGVKWQVDEFAGENEGLVIAEVETSKAPEEIPKPEWLGEDVTDDPRYSNVNLVKQPYSRWKQPEYR